MKKIIKKTTVMVLLFAMVASVLTGCNLFGKKVKKDPNAAAKLAESKQYVWKTTDLYTVSQDWTSGGGVYKYLNRVNATDDRVYISVNSNRYSEDTCEYIYENQAFSMKYDGTDMRDEFIPTDTNTYDYDEETGAYSGSSKSYSNWCIDKEGNHYYSCYDYSYSYGTGEDYEYSQNVTLVKFDKSGKVLKEVPLPEDIEDVSSMTLLNDGRFILSNWENTFILDKDFNVISKADLTNFSVNSMNQLSDGRVIAIGYNTNDYADEVREFDLNTGKLSGKLESKIGLWNAYPGKSTDFILTGNTGIYSYNLGDSEQKLIMDFIDSDFPNTWFSNLVAVDDTHMLGVYSEYLDNGNVSHVVMMTKIPPEEVKDKIILEIACVYPDSNLMKNVVDFNKNSDEYRFRIKDYSVYSNDDDWEGDVKQLNNDIIAGNTPDILVYSPNLPYTNYVAKGLFADARKLMDKDENFNRADYLENVLDAYTMNDICYVVPISFDVETVAMKSSLVDKYPVWNAAAMKDLWDKYPSASMYTYTTRESFVQMMTGFSGTDYIDWAKGTCNFTSDEFKAVLEIAKKFPEEIGDDIYDEEYWEEYDQQYRKNKTLGCSVYLSSLKDLRFVRYGQFGEEISLVGYPSADGNGSILNADTGYSIISKSYYPEACWEFIKRSLTQEAQEKLSYTFPVYKKAFDKLKEAALERDYWEDPDGNREYYDDYYYIGNEQVVIPPMTEAEVEEVYKFVTSVDRIVSYDKELTKIIYEEAGAYWSGQKSLDDVCNVIQSRARTYISENM